MPDLEIIQPVARKDDIPLISDNDLVMGGYDGPANKQAIALANNMAYLYEFFNYKKTSIFDMMTEEEYAEFKTSEPRTFDFTNIINRSLAGFNSVLTLGTKQVLYLPAIAGGYKTTDTIWLPKHTGLLGDSGGLWQYTMSQTKPSSDIYADFNDPYKFVISSDTRLISTNNRIQYYELIEGGTMDGNNYTWSDGIFLSGFRVGTKNRVFGGVKLIGAVGSYIDPSVTITGCDYGYVTSACWNAQHLGNSLSYKCGYLSYDAANGTEVDGYHNNSGAPILTDKNLINFFENGYSIPYQLLNDITKTFGVIIRKAFGVFGGRVIAESSDFPLVLTDRCQASFNTVYAERVGIVAMTIGNQCQLDIGNAVGGLVNGAAMHLGTHARLCIQNYYMIANVKHIYPDMAWGDTAVASLPSRYMPEYHQNIIWNDKNDNIVYISPNGSDSASGSSYFSPTNLTQAIKRISNEVERYDKTLKLSNNKSVVFYLVSAGTYTLNEAYLTLYGRVTIKRKSILKTEDTILNMNNFVYLSNCSLDISSVKLQIPNKNFDYVSWARNAPFINIGGINSLMLDSVQTVFDGTNNAIASFTNTCESIFTLNIKSGSIVGAGSLVQRAESENIGYMANINIGASCAVDDAIKNKTNKGIEIGNNQRGIVRIPWKVAVASVVYDPAPLPANTVASTNITLTGAAVGDVVACSFSLPLGGTRMWAEVTASNTITVYHQNPLSVTVDLASGTLLVKLV